VHHREKRSFEPTNQEAIGSQFSKARHPILQKGEDSPSNIQKGEKPVNWDVRQKEEEGDLANDSTDDVKGLQLNELIALEPKVLLKTGHIGIV
jgi:hypothetical protein